MIKYDLHCHTHLSKCGSQTDATVPLYVQMALDYGIKTIGFSDHAWDPSVGKPSSWYESQDFERLIKCRTEAQQYSDKGVRLLFGCEAELANGVLGFNRHSVEKLDYVLVAVSHTHMTGFVIPESRTAPRDQAEFMLENFDVLMNHPDREVVLGVVHPFHAIGKSPEFIEELFSYISDSQLSRCFEAASKNNIALELNLSAIKKFTPEQFGDFCYSRVFRLAKKAGCKFFFGSDRHSALRKDLNDAYACIDGYLPFLGLDENDFIAL